MSREGVWLATQRPKRVGADAASMGAVWLEAIRRRRSWLALAAVLAIVVLGSEGLTGAASAPRRSEVIVIDAGHGGADFGARGRRGVLEKTVVLQVARRIGRRLSDRGFRVVLTRDGDDFVSLTERTEIANRARGDLFLSIHANSAASAKVEGAETYFLSLDASDDEAMRVAMIENQVFRQVGTSPDDSYLVGSILGDLIRTEHLRVSSEVAAAVQRRLAELGASRGVKQAPFVVLVGVNMPAALVELGFLTHPAEERKLRQRKYQQNLADAISDAVMTYYQTRGPREEGLPPSKRGADR